MYPETTGYLACHGAELYYEIGGKGLPLVLVHAGIADQRMWNPLVDRLAASHQVIRYDLRGYGRSLVPDGTFPHHEDLYQIYRALHLPPAMLVGASMGGGVAASFALTHPELVERLILVNASVPGWDWSKEVQAFGANEERLLEQGDIAAAVELNVQTWVVGSHRSARAVNGEFIASVQEMQTRAFQLANPSAEEEVLQPLAMTQLANIHVPTLVVMGEQDVSDILQIGNALASAIPQAELKRIPGTTHLPSMENPNAFYEAIAPFLAG